MGRPRKPTSLKVIKGTNRPDRNEPQTLVAAGVPDCPDWLGDEAKKYWDLMAPQLEQEGLLSVLDLAPFALHCQAWGFYVEQAISIDGPDDFVDITTSGFKSQGVAIQLLAKFHDQVIKTGSQFGLTVKDRGNIKSAPKSDKPKNPFGAV